MSIRKYFRNSTWEISISNAAFAAHIHFLGLILNDPKKMKDS